MKKVKITADSTCDLTKELIEKHDIGIIPLYINLGEQTYKDGLEINSDQLFAYVESGKGHCRTSAVNIFDYKVEFSEYLKEYDQIVHLNISSEFSSCNQNAAAAAWENENIFVVDTKNLSTGSGLLVLQAARLAKEGHDGASLKKILDENVKKVNASFILNTLEYLKLGGRCSPVAALGANLLHIKPCIEVEEGRMDVGKKYRGSLEKVLVAYVDDRLQGIEEIDPSAIFITHSGVENNIVSKIHQIVSEKNYFKEIYITRAGCTISSHCGPNTLGILFCHK